MLEGGESIQLEINYLNKFSKFPVWNIMWDYTYVKKENSCLLIVPILTPISSSKSRLSVHLPNYLSHAYLQNKILNYTVTRWKKNSFKQRNGLCYSLAKNNYCPELAKDFQYAGQVGEKWASAVARLRTLQAQARVTKDYVKSEITNPKNIRTVVRKAPKLWNAWKTSVSSLDLYRPLHLSASDLFHSWKFSKIKIIRYFIKKFLL